MTIDIVVTIKSLEEGEKLVKRCVLLVKVYGILDCMAIYTKIIKSDNYYNYHVKTNITSVTTYAVTLHVNCNLHLYHTQVTFRVDSLVPICVGS